MNWVSVILIAAVLFTLNSIAHLIAGDYGLALIDGLCGLVAWAMFLSDDRR